MKMLGTIGQMNTWDFNKLLYVDVVPEDRKFNMNDIKCDIEVDLLSGKILEEIRDLDGNLIDKEGNKIN